MSCLFCSFSVEDGKISSALESGFVAVAGALLPLLPAFCLEITLCFRSRGTNLGIVDFGGN